MGLAFMHIILKSQHNIYFADSFLDIVCFRARAVLDPCFVMLYMVSFASFAIILLRKREQFALL